MFGLFKSKKLLVTHDGKFHCDDLFACASIQIYLDKKDFGYELRRTRDEQLIKKGDYVFDVGGIHDPSINRYDHHQKGGAGERANGIPYASFGLVWETLGAEICGNAEIKNLVEEELVMPVDADDSGYKLFDLKTGIAPYRIQEFFYSSRPTWKEEPNFDETFVELLPQVKKLIKRLIKKSEDYLEARTIVKNAYENSADKRLVTFDINLPPATSILTEHPEPLYAVSPRPEGTWRVEAVTKGRFTFESRKPFPEAWRGERDAGLQAVTGVSDAVFCHNGGFMAVAQTKDGAMALAKAALNS